MGSQAARTSDGPYLDRGPDRSPTAEQVLRVGGADCSGESLSIVLLGLLGSTGLQPAAGRCANGIAASPSLSHVEGVFTGRFQLGKSNRTGNKSEPHKLSFGVAMDPSKMAQKTFELENCIQVLAPPTARARKCNTSSCRQIYIRKEKKD